MSDVVHSADRHRFQFEEADARAVLTYSLGDGVVTFEHTIVPSELEGRGIGSQLAAAGLEWARAEHLAVVPNCPFFRSYVERHPEATDGIEVRPPRTSAG